MYSDVGGGRRGIHDRASGFTGSFQPGIGRGQETLWPQTILDLNIQYIYNFFSLALAIMYDAKVSCI